MPQIKFTKVHGMITSVGSVLAIMIAWNTLGWETLAYTSEVDTTYAFAQDTRLMILNQRKTAAENSLFFAKIELEKRPDSQIIKDRITNLNNQIADLKTQIAAVKNSN